MSNHDDDQSPDSADAPDETEAPLSSKEEERPQRSAAKKKGSGKSRREAPAPTPAVSSRAMLVAALALAAGGAAGWFGHIAQAQAKIRAESVASPAGSGVPAGPCGAWQKKICAGSGDQSAACAQAKGASDLLTPSTCEVALAGVPATLAKVKAERVPCDNLVNKLCADLTPGSSACAMVKERTPSFPHERCSQMLERYADVLGELKQMEQQQGPQMGGSPHGMPPGAAPGAPPGAAPGAP